MPQGVTLTNNGTILVQGGEVTGTVSGNQPTYPSKVTVSFSQNGQTVNSVPYGSTVTITATMEKAETAANALSTDTGKVDFYLGDANDTGMKMGTGTVEFEDGAYTAAVDVTINQDKGFNNAGTFKFTADFGGYAPEGNETGDSLAPATGSAELTVTKAEQTAPAAPTVSTTTPNSITLDAITTTGQGDVQYGYTTGEEATVPNDRWQIETIFDNLAPGTTYTFYARYAGNNCYEPSPASSGKPVTTERYNSSLKVETTEDTLTYGDKLEIKVTPQSTDTNARTIAKGTVELKKDDTVLASTTTVDDDGSYTLTYDTKQKGLPIGENTLTVSFGGSDSLNPSTAEVTVTLENANLNATLEGTTSKTYDGTTNVPEGLTVALQNVLDGDEVTESSGSISYDSANVGDNKTITATGITLTGADAAYYSLTSDTATVPGSITPAEQDALAISGLPDKVYVGDQFTLTASGGTGDGALSWKVVSGSAEIDASTGAVRVTGEGQIVIRATKSKDATHSATSTEITFTANEVPYTGKYSYEISTSVGDHGAISVDRYATEGDEVTITVSPDEAYKLDDLSVTVNGKDVELTDNGDGTFSFTMPSGDVKITASFAEDPDWTEPEEPSTDVSDLFLDIAPDAWYKDAVQYAYDNGLMTGVSDTEFAPEATTTRAMIVSILARLENVTSAESAGFADVSADDWYATAVNWAASAGVVSGTGDGNFSPNAAITREQLAAMLMNYAAYKGEDVSARADLSDYSDAATISSWANDVMSWAVAEDLISGMTEDTLAPQSSATRAQVAAILQRFLCK